MYFEYVPVNGLKIICGVPRGVKEYDNIRTNKIKTQSTSPKNEKTELFDSKKSKTRFCLFPIILGPHQYTLLQHRSKYKVTALSY